MSYVLQFFIAAVATVTFAILFADGHITVG